MFLSRQKSVVLATLNKNLDPLASYSPFHRDNSGTIYIFVSQLSNHTSNLNNGKVSAMFIADEQDTSQIYARERLYFQCRATIILQHDKQYSLLLDKLQKKHGNIIPTLRNLADFHLFKLSPQHGRYIQGFGQAYRINPQLTDIHPI